MKPLVEIRCGYSKCNKLFKPKRAHIAFCSHACGLTYSALLQYGNDLTPMSVLRAHAQKIQRERLLNEKACY